jgi:predicted amidohydrolase
MKRSFYILSLNLFFVFFTFFLLNGCSIERNNPDCRSGIDSGYYGRMKIKVALLQMQPFGNDQQKNMDKAERFCRKAAEMDADIALMGEMWNIGYTRFDPDKPGARQEFWKQAVPKSDQSIQRFAKLAKELDMAIAVTYLQQWKPLPRNSVTLFDRHGKEVFTYAKVHTSDFLPLEASMTPGTDFYVQPLDTEQGCVMVGAMICFDREQPESARILMLKGAELILTPNCCNLDDIRLQQFRVRAYENVCDVAMTNYPAPYKNGHSVAYDYNGKCRAAADESEGVFIAEFDIEKLRKRRQKVKWGNAYRKPRRYHLLISEEKDEIWNRIDGNGNPWDASKR